MAAGPNVDCPVGWLRSYLRRPGPAAGDGQSFAEALMSAEVDAICGAAYGERSTTDNSRNGYRHRDWDTRAGTIELAVPKLREGTYFPDWLWSGAAGPNGADQRGRHELPARGLHPADGEAGRAAGDRADLKSQVTRWPRSSTAGGGVPDPAAGRRALHLPRGRRADAKVREGGRIVNVTPAGHRGERRRLPGDPRPGPHLRRGRRRLAGVPARSGGPRPVRGRSW